MGQRSTGTRPQAADTPTIVWQAEGSQLGIEFGAQDLEKVRQLCAAGRISGLLYGTRSGDMWRVVEWRRIEDVNPPEEAAPVGSVLLGWFSSSRDDELMPPDEDQLHLAIRSTPRGDAVIAVHAPDAGAPGLRRPRLPELRIQRRRDGDAAGREPATRPVHFAAGFAGLLVVATAFGVHGWEVTQAGARHGSVALAAQLSPPKRLLSMHARHAPQRLDVEWDPKAYDGEKPISASLTCMGAGDQRSYPVDDGSLQRGRAAIGLGMAPQSVTLMVRTRSGGELKETVRIAPPRPPAR